MKDGALITISKFNYDTPIIVPLWVFCHVDERLFMPNWIMGLS